MASFLGTFQHTIDNKGRVSVPTKFRKYLKVDEEDSVIITLGLDGCLFGFPEEEWLRVQERLQALSLTQANNRLFVRLLASNAVAVSVDPQGRVPLPKPLITLAAIETPVLFIGAVNHFEIWSPPVYERYLAGSGQTFEGVAETILW